MVLKGIPSCLTPDLLHVLASMVELGGVVRCGVLTLSRVSKRESMNKDHQRMMVDPVLMIV